MSPEGIDSSDVGPDVRVFDSESLTPGTLRWDMLMAAVPFDRLLKRCVEVYLDEPGRYEESLAAQDKESPEPEAVTGEPQVRVLNQMGSVDAGEADLLRKTGMWGANAAVVQTAIAARDGTDDKLWFDAAVRRPELFAQPADPWTAKRLAAFGEAYMASMYQALGVEAPRPEDVNDVNDQLRAFDTVFDAIHKLGARADAPGLAFDEQQIYRMLAEEDDRGRPYYDPLVLSAKAYPNNNGVRPSCAAQMAMVAGFCEAAGWPHLTASTLMESELNVLNCLGRATEESICLWYGNELQLHPMDRKAMRKTTRHIEQALARDRGFHGCNLVRLQDGGWWQVDMTRGIVQPYKEIHSERLDVVYGTLQVGEQAKLPAVMPFNELDVLDTFDYISSAARDAATRLRSLEEVESQLYTMKRLRQLSFDRIVDEIILPVLLPEGVADENTEDGNYRQAFDRLILEYFPKLVEADCEGKEFVRQTVRSLVTKWALMTDSSFGQPGMEQPHRILHGNRPCQDNCLRKSVDHPVKIEMLAHWLRSAPLMFYQKMANDFANKMLEPGNFPMHPSLELSTPAIHLAATVLSADSAIYGDDSRRLPAAWWPTYDPTHYGSLVHMGESTGTSSLGTIVNELQLLRHLPTDSLLQTTKTARIEEFLGRNKRG